MLIGIHGIQGSGKDTLCDMITELYPDTERRPQAEPVKEAAATFLKTTREFVELTKNDPSWRIVVEHEGRPDKHITEITMREFIRLVGHDGRRIFGEDIWINLNFGKLDRSFHWDRVVCVTDVRYENEAEAVKRYGGYIVHIIRPDVERPDHGSEAGIPGHLIDYVINNDKGLEEFRMATRALMYDLQANAKGASVAKRVH